MKYICSTNAYSVLNPLSVNTKPTYDEKIIAELWFGFKNGKEILGDGFITAIGHLEYDKDLECDVFISEEDSKWAFVQGKTPRTIMNIYWDYFRELRVKDKHKNKLFRSVFCVSEDEVFYAPSGIIGERFESNLKKAVEQGNPKDGKVMVYIEFEDEEE